MLLVSCADKEQEARKVQNLAISLERDGKYADALEKYKKIVNKYPSTNASIESNQKISAIQAKLEFDQKRISRARSDIGAISAASDLFNLDHSEYPESLSDLVGEYLKGLSNDPWGNSYEYLRSSTKKEGKFWSKGPDGTSNTEDDISSM